MLVERERARESEREREMVAAAKLDSRMFVMFSGTATGTTHDKTVNGR